MITINIMTCKIYNRMYTLCSPLSSPQRYLLTLLTCLSGKNQKQWYTSNRRGFVKKIEYKQIKYNQFWCRYFKLMVSIWNGKRLLAKIDNANSERDLINCLILNLQKNVSLWSFVPRVVSWNGLYWTIIGT